MFSSSLARAASRSVARAGASRTLAVAAEHRPPVDLHGLQARYANATYVAASKSNSLEKVDGELLAIKATAGTTPAFASFLENPLISRDDKEAQVTDMLSGKVTPVTLNLMTTLAGNARLSEVPKIVDTYVELMKAKRGEVEAVIISADKLTKAQAEAVASAMKGQVGAGKKVVLSTKVDPTIIGGLQIQIGDQFLDLSVSSKIDALSRTVV
eukprot:CAMPEP_0197433030 /NCGR_PEP_ID=MMETSP1175-20131217/982_1 /TAXON_ID=1003142 /ORGANISM="Triceratium dubium, Strain CCMP147" /LENGTH=211 /DNA_ID=CAMNT_0042961275 /DNA_START=26 /DNA_END=661 /DNA_ORIENTATION=+